MDHCPVPLSLLMNSTQVISPYKLCSNRKINIPSKKYKENNKISCNRQTRHDCEKCV